MHEELIAKAQQDLLQVYQRLGFLSYHVNDHESGIDTQLWALERDMRELSASLKALGALRDELRRGAA